MPKKRPCFPSGRIMPDNLYHHKDKARRGQAYRYRHPDGRMELVKTCDESIAEKVANALNEQREAAPTFGNDEAHTSQSGNKLTDRQFGYWVEDFIETTLAGKRVSESKRKAYEYNLRKHFADLYNKHCARLRRPDFLKIWNAMTYHAQKNSRPIFRSCVNHMINKELLLSLTNGNPFIRACDGGFDYKEIEDKKRKTMPVPLFIGLLETAEKLEMPFLVDALQMGYLTGLRLSDVLSLRFTDVENGVLTKVISKTASRKKTKQAANAYAVEEFQDIQAIISRAKLRLPHGSDCPFIIHNQYRRVVRGAHTKEHPYQVTRFYINECLHKCMDEIDYTKNMSRSERPTFHEIRALIFEVLDQGNVELKTISALLGHADTKITESAYGTHKTIEVNTITTPRSLKELKGYATKNV